MTSEIIVRYFHFLSIFTLFSAVVLEHLLIKPQLTRKEIAYLFRIDGIYGISAILVVALGLTLWLGVGKPAEFYSKNWIFHLKFGLFIILGILSIHPTRFFFKHRKGNENELVDVPPSIKWVIRIELLILVLMPLCATLMAKGIGQFE